MAKASPAKVYTTIERVYEGKLGWQAPKTRQAGITRVERLVNKGKPKGERLSREEVARAIERMAGEAPSALGERRLEKGEQIRRAEGQPPLRGRYKAPDFLPTRNPRGYIERTKRVQRSRYTHHLVWKIRTRTGAESLPKNYHYSDNVLGTWEEILGHCADEAELIIQRDVADWFGRDTNMPTPQQPEAYDVYVQLLTITARDLSLIHI